MSLTGNDDVNAKILLSFSYQDCMNTCHANKYMNALCHNNIDLRRKLSHAKDKAWFIIHLFDKGKDRKRFILQSLNENEPFTSFEHILRYMNNEYQNDRGNPCTIPKNFNVTSRSDGFLVTNSPSFFLSKMTIDQLYNFITICYYNNLVI